MEIFDLQLEAKRSESIARGARYAKEPTAQEQAGIRLGSLLWIPSGSGVRWIPCLGLRVIPSSARDRPVAPPARDLLGSPQRKGASRRSATRPATRPATIGRTRECQSLRQAAALQPSLVAASLLGGAETLPPFDASSAELLERRAITLSCFSEACTGSSASVAQDLLCRDDPRIGFAPLRVDDIFR